MDKTFIILGFDMETLLEIRRQLEIQGVNTPFTPGKIKQFFEEFCNG